MKTRRKISVLLLSVTLMAIALGCSNEDDAITLSMSDVSSRITGFSSTVTGAGASLTLNGSQMDKVLRIFMNNAVVTPQGFTSVSESSITFNVPLAVELGENNVLVVFPGSERAFAKINVIPFQAVSSFLPLTVTEGEPVTIFGANLEIVNEVRLGSATATILSQSADMLRFTVPAGVTTGKITLVSAAGSSDSSADLIACSGSSTNPDCFTGLNLNTGFELGDGDNFTNWSKFNGGTLMTATTAANEVYRGSRAMKVTRDGTLASGEWRLQLASDLVATEVGASYTAYITARATVAGGSIRVSTNPNAVYTANQNVPTSWTRLGFTFTANEANTRVVLDMNGNNTVATTFFIDDVKLVKN